MYKRDGFTFDLVARNFGMQHNIGKLLLIFVLFFASINIRTFSNYILYNVETIRILRTLGRGNGNEIELWKQGIGRISPYQEFFLCAAGSLSTQLAILTDQLQLAEITFQKDLCIQSRFMFPDVSWKISNRLLTGGTTHGWFDQRRVAIYTMFLNALRDQQAGELNKSLKWFQKGLILLPGRIPDYVRQQYYTLIADLYAHEVQDIHLQRLSMTALCLTKKEAYECLNTLEPSVLQEWPLPEYLVNQDTDWQLAGLKIDPYVLELGLEVRGRLYWRSEDEWMAQDFLVPNLASNSSFEISELYQDNCVAGYVSSNLYVSPCTSHVLLDPDYPQRRQIAIIEVQKDDVALVSSTFPIEPSKSYLVGGQLCTKSDARALVGYTSIKANEEANQVHTDTGWFFEEKMEDIEASCWQKHTAVFVPSQNVLELSLRLHAGNSEFDHGVGSAMFDDVFFFELPQFDK